jgi:hypothetical protein
MNSPYLGKPLGQWKLITKEILDQHPLTRGELKAQVLESWNDIFESELGTVRIKIGQDIFPKPQIMGFLLHELIARSLAKKHQSEWRGEEEKDDKDLVCIRNNAYSIEIKTSSHKDQVFGNRSYAQKGARSGKNKSGYYLLVNFEGFRKDLARPSIRLIRFGWIDHGDWIGQQAATGQQARLPNKVYENKFEIL